MTHSDLASFLSRTFLPQATFRASVLPAMVALSAVFTAPHAWATAAPTTTALTITSAGSEATSVTAGTVVTLTARVVSGSTPVNPGQVKFCDASAKYCEDSALLATAQLTPAGVATYKFRPGIGSHSYQAVFIGTHSYTKSTSTTLDLTVTGLHPTTTTLAASGSVGNYTLTATVVAAGSHTLSPTGTVSFQDTTNGNASLGSTALGTATSGESFTTASVPAISGSPAPIVVADFNGDGIPDLVNVYPDNGANPTLPGPLNVLLGNGDGTFTLKFSLAIDFYPSAVAVGDFNGDGIPDLAVTSYGGNTVTVLLGNGDGTFTIKSTLAVGWGPWWIAAGDFNGDGIPDLVVADENDNALTVLLGNGDGTFTTKTTPNAGIPIFVLVADFNADGIQDLAFVQAIGGTVTVLLGNGDGTFTPKSSTNAGGAGGVPIAVGDFNGDGIPDLASETEVLLGNGDGTFTVEPLPSVGYDPFSVAVGDFNADGILDLVVANIGYTAGDQQGGTITLLLGNGDGTFTAQVTPNATLAPSYVAVGDFNGDGIPDLATIDAACLNCSSPPVVRVLLNQITHTATVGLSQVSVSGTETHLVEASYPGDTNYDSSISRTVPVLAAQIATTLNLSSSANPSPPGNGISLTANLNPYLLGSFTTNGEAVTFYNGGTSIGTGTLSSGVATLNIYSGSLPLGTNMLTANYPGDGNFAAATSNAIAQVVETRVATPVFSLAAGFYYTTQTVKITDTTPGAIIYYTTDGTTPTTSSTVYAVPVIVSNSETLQAIAIAPNYFQSNLATAAYTIAAGIPVLSPPSGTYTTPQMVSITSGAPGATIYYTTDGTVPSYASPIFNPMQPILVNATETIKAYAVASGYALSPQGVANYTIIPPYAPTPTFSLAAGYYNSSVMVSIMDSLAGATIHYTTDHTTPTTSSPVYGGGPITISSTERLQAIAVAPNYSPSAVALSDYYIATAEPVISLPTGTYKGTQMVSITDATPGAVIYYTTDGTVPNRASPTVSPGGSITVSASEIVKAIAVAAGYTASPQAAAWYTITP